MADLVSQLQDDKQCQILGISSVLGGQPLPLSMMVACVLYSEDYPAKVLTELFAVVKDKTETVQQTPAEPVSQKLVEQPIMKFKTISKYTLFESGKFCKVLLPDLANLKDHPKEDLVITFNKRSVEVKAMGIKGVNLQFAVPKLQCRINPELCTVTHKSSGLQLNLRNKNEAVNWFSLFKTKAVGERESDDDSDKN